MKYFLSIILSFTAVNSKAAPPCLSDGSCFEYEGQIIDMRSSAKKALDSLKPCDPLAQDCLEFYSDAPVPELSAKEFKHLVGKDGNEYFIPIKQSDLFLLAGTLSLGTIVFANEREILDYVQEQNNEHTAKVANIGNMLGREAIVPIVAGSYFVGAVLKNDKLKKVGIFTVRAGLATQIVTELFKKSFARKRPNATNDPYEFFEEGHHAFYSGHTSAAFSMATVIAEVYKDKPLVPYLAYGAAALTAYARMHDNKHWATDVLVGAVAGHLVTKIFMRTFDKSGGLDASGLIIMPEYKENERGESSYGMRLEYRKRSEPTPLACKDSGLTGKELFTLCLEEAYYRSQE